MSANRKVIMIVILGAGACLLSFILSQHFSRKIQDNQMLLAKVQQLSEKVEYIQILSRDFIQSGDQGKWRKIIGNIDIIRRDFGEVPGKNQQWHKETQDLQNNLAEYYHTLSRIHDPAIQLNAEKNKLQGLGLSFSMEIMDRIIEPYRKEEGMQIYKGNMIDPFKTRTKETAYDLVRLHLQQQLILQELLMDWDLAGYLRKKQDIAQALEMRQVQLHYMSVLMGAEKNIDDIIASLAGKLSELLKHEQVILDLFTGLTQMNKNLNTAGDSLLGASENLSLKIVSDISYANKLNNYSSWGLLITIIGVLSGLGAWLAGDIIRFVRDLNVSRENLRSSETNLKVTLDSIGDAVIATDKSGVVTRMNPMAEQLTGWSSAEAVGGNLADVFKIVNAFTRNEAASPVEKVLASGEITGLANHTILISKEGREYQIADSGAPIRLADGRVVGVVLVFRDVTEAYAQEQKIRENESLLKNITTNFPGVVFQFNTGRDLVFTCRYVSPRVRDVFGLEASDDFFEDFIRHIPESERERFRASFLTAANDSRPWHYEGLFNKSSGQTIWFSGNASLQKTGTEIFFNGVFMDITERRRMEAALHITQFSFDKASIGIYRVGDDGRILNVNERAAQILGYSLEELASLSVFDIDPRVDRDIWNRIWARLSAGIEDVFETFHRHKDGSDVPIELTSKMLEYDGQHFAIAFVQDISERIKVQKEAQQFEEALYQAQKIEAIGTLAGGIAHDFNNILSAVIGFSELSLSMTEDVESPVHQYLQYVVTAGLRARDLVRQILTFSRKDERELNPLQVGPLVKESLKMLRSSLPTTVEMSQNIGENLDNILADPTHIHQIIMNLCTNAAHAMEDDGGHLNVELSQVELSVHDLRLHPGLRPGNYLKLSVQDTGRGIHPDIIEKIYDPYFTTKEKEKGTGLGLAVVHGIVKSYGGAIHTYSELNTGTTFNIYIPTVEKATAVEETTISDLPRGSEHILLVDDEPVLLDVGRHLLEKLGYRISTAGGSMPALELFQRGP